MHTELLEIISDGENSGVEFKRDVLEKIMPSPRSWSYSSEPEWRVRFSSAWAMT